MPAVASPATCRLNKVASFRPGTWNGKPYTLADLKALANNFEQFSQGDQPYYRPYVSINHDDGLAFGRVVRAYVSGDTLYLDVDEVPEEVGQWVNGGNLQAPSIEFFEPEVGPDGKPVDGFRGPDGQIVDTPVLKCLTLLGNKPPAVKGLPPLPTATFSHRGKVRRFSGEKPMDRQAMIDALSKLGVDVSLITDAIPDPFLQAVLGVLQAQAQSAGAGGQQAMSDDKDKDDKGYGGGTAMMNQAGAGAGGQAVTVPAVGGGAVGNPQSITLKFADQASATAMNGILGAMTAQLNAIKANQAAVQQWQAQQLAEAKRVKVSQFCDKLTAAGKMLPASRPTIEALLNKCDDVNVRKFSDGKSVGSELAEAMASLEAGPVLRRMGDKINDGTTAATTMTADAKRAMLAATPLGRAALARQAK